MLDMFRSKPFKCFIGEYENRKIRSRSFRGIKPINVEKIVGTVGRCHDNSNWKEIKRENRYQGVLNAVENMEKMPPIKVYEVEGKYYIVDGHHRVMASRDIDRHYIDAEIIEYKFKEKAEGETNGSDYHECPMKEFNEKTGLWGILLKTRESYNSLLESIKVFGMKLGENLPIEDISLRWYKEEFLKEESCVEKEEELTNNNKKDKGDY